MNILKLENVSYHYKNQNHYVLDQVMQNFELGKFYAILGPSGAGKSTLLSLLAGLDEPSSGRILFKDEDIVKTGYPNHRKEHVSLIFQSYNLIDYLTPLENLQLIKKDAKKDILIDLGLSEKEINRNILRLSGGQQQRVAIGRALVSDAPILLADEPTGNLDELTAEEMIQIFQKIAHKKNKTVIAVTHSKQLAEAADIVFQLKDGKLWKV